MYKKLIQICYRDMNHPHNKEEQLSIPTEQIQYLPNSTIQPIYQNPFSYIINSTYKDGTKPEHIYIDEIFLSNPNFPNFLIGNHGTIYDVLNNYIIKGFLSNGYKYVCLNGNSISVHRLIMITFNPIPNMNKMEVNHKDGNVLNNYYHPNPILSNLEWCTHQQNVQHAYDIKLNNPSYGENKYNAKYTDKEVRKICEMLQDGYSSTEIGKELGRNDWSFYRFISNLRLGKAWTWMTKDYNLTQAVRHTEEEIKICCELIQNGMPYESIVEYMRDQYGYQLTYDFVRTLKTNKNWKHITKDYNFPSHLKRPISEETIHQICYLLQSGVTDYKEIAKELEMELDQRLRLLIYSLYTKSHYKEICDQYNYKFESKIDILTEDEVKLICHGLVKKMNSREIVEQLLHREYTMSLKSKINQIKHRKYWTEISKHYDFNI